MKDKSSEALMLINLLKKLHDEVDKINPDDAAKPKHSGSGITVFIRPFNDLLERTRELLLSHGRDLTSINHIRAQREIQERLNVAYHRKAKHGILIGIAHLLAVLEPLYGSGASLPSMKVTKEGIYFGGEYFDALMAAANLIAQARNKIKVIDGYVNEETLKLLSGKQSGIDVQVLTMQRSVTPAFETTARAFNAQHEGLEVRVSEEFHDRFIIIDDAEYYHFGASIKDLGRRSFMFSRIKEPEIIDKLRDKFTDEWNKAKIVL